jgi:hypothetical protein
MQESGSKFLFDQTSQGGLKYEEANNFSSFNSRFPQQGFDFFFSKLASNQIDEASNLNKTFQSIRTPHNLNSEQKDKISFDSKPLPEKEPFTDPKSASAINIEPEETRHHKKRGEKVDT